MSDPGLADSDLETRSVPSAAAAGRVGIVQGRMLLVKLGAIGDVIMAIPAAKARHAAGFQIDWLCSEAVAPVLRCYPWINVLSVDEPMLLRGPLPKRVKAMARLWQMLAVRTSRYGSYDTVATLYYDDRYRLLTLPIRARSRLRLSRQDRARTLLPGRHHTDEYDRMLSGRPDGETPSQLAPVPVPQLPPPPRPLQESRLRVVLVPAGAKNALRDDALRRWPIGNYVALAGLLIAEGYEVVLAGGPDDHWATPYFAALAETAGQASFGDHIGRCSLLETLSLMDSAAVTVTHDTGPLHLAGITSTAIVTLFGPTDPHGRLPHRANCVAIWGGSGFACRPCYDGRDYAPCEHNGCMAQITPEQVLNEVQRLVDARRTGQSLSPRVISPAPASLVSVRLGGDR